MSLINADEFVGLEDVVHLAAGGETPMLCSHSAAINQFIADKARGEMARKLQADLVSRTREQSAALFQVPASDLTFLSSSSEGINVVAFGLKWRKGDNVVIADVEFASGILPWTLLRSQGVEIRIVRHRNWHISLDDIASEIDKNTRVALMSQVSMFTGQRLPLAALSELVHSHGAALVVDATHAAGVVPVEAHYADVVVSSCYKWLLGVHGVAIFYHNKQRFPELEPPFLGWDSTASSGGWQDPTNVALHEDAHRFKPANPSFLGIYILNNALERLLALGINPIEEHALSLTDRLWEGVANQGWEMMTPEARESRAGNVCIMSDRVDEIAQAMRKKNILVWGSYGSDARLRISAHVYNDLDDIEQCIDAMQSVLT